MTYLLVLCEGVLEKRVLKPFLRPYWQRRFQNIEIQNYDGNGALSANFKADAEQQLAQEPDSSVVCLVDLYREPFGLYTAHDMTVEEGYRKVREHMYQQIKPHFHTRFGGFPVVMEPETWLLGDFAVQRYLNETIEYPETILHPYSFLETNYAARHDQYGKIASGVDLFGKANAERVYKDHCPHFNQLADWLANPPPAIVVVDPHSEAVIKTKEEWLAQLDEKHKRLLEFEHRVEFGKNPTDLELDLAIQARIEFDIFVQSYSSIFN